MLLVSGVNATLSGVVMRPDDALPLQTPVGMA